jgi:hypothetical protein
VVLAAASAVALGGNAVAEWGPKLYGEGTDGERAFAIAGELVGGNYTRLLDLPVALGMMEREQKRTIQWQEIAAALEEAAGKDTTRAGWRNAAVALRMLALWRSARNPQQPALGTGFFCGKSSLTARAGTARMLAWSGLNPCAG